MPIPGNEVSEEDSMETRERTGEACYVLLYSFA